MRIKDFKDENVGQVLSLDLMLGFVLITVIVGISADAMDIASYKMQDYSSRTSMERVTTDAADILIKSSGSPANWEKYSIGQATVPGLAKRDFQTGRTVPNTLSIQKIFKLRENYDNLIYGQILPYGFNSSMMLYSSNDSFTPISIMNNTPPADVYEVTVVNRTVILDFMRLKVIIYNNMHKGNASIEKCPNPDHKPYNSSGKPEWHCSHFNMTGEELNSSDFYLITRGDVSSSARWVIDKADKQNNTGNSFNHNPILVNDKITELMGNNTKSVLWLHIITSGTPENSYDCYIVSVPRRTTSDMVDIKYLDSGPWFFVLRVWR